MTSAGTGNRAAGNRTATENSCKVCSPLGASIVFKGIRGAVPILHGSQGCSTYIRRYLIGHFREPVDIATSSFSESTAIFGGRDNLFKGLTNVIRQYHPRIIGIATTCLSETIGEDVAHFVKEFKEMRRGKFCPEIIHVSTPSYQGSHSTGFYSAVLSLVAGLAGREGPAGRINLFPGLVSPADLRCLKKLFSSFGLQVNMIPDYSETLDGASWDRFTLLPEGGTELDDIRSTGSACASIEFCPDPGMKKSAGKFLEDEFSVPLFRHFMPVGIRQTDALVKSLEKLAKTQLPEEYRKERGRLVDSYVDAHKFVSGKRVIIFGDQAMTAGLVSFAAEIGLKPVICATGDSDKGFEAVMRQAAPELGDDCVFLYDADFQDIEAAAESAAADVIIGSSKGYPLARKSAIPLVRVGFPIQDRIGAQRILHVGYSGTQQLFDRVVNALIEHDQDRSPVGYQTY